MLRLTKAAIAALGFGALAMMPATNAVAQTVEHTETPFFFGLKAGESALLGRSGPLLIRARCVSEPHDWYDYYDEREPPEEGLYWLELWVKGRRDGWFHEQQDECDNGCFQQQPLPAGRVEFIADETNYDNGGPFSPHYDNERNEFTAISPRGGNEIYTLGFDGDSLGIGIRVLGFDCLVHGVLQGLKITDLPARSN